jgi:hypothetical protein
MIDPFTVPNTQEYMLDGLDLEVTLLYRNTFETKIGKPKPVQQLIPTESFDEEG